MINLTSPVRQLEPQKEVKTFDFVSGLIAEITPLITEQVKSEAIRELTKQLPVKTVVVKDGIEVAMGDAITHELFEPLLKLVNNKVPVMLVGEAGTGKNHTAEQVAKALELEFYFTGSVTQEYKLTGFIDANGIFQETQFYKAFTKGGIFFLDEVDASTPEALIILNSALANGYFDFPNGKVFAHENFRVIAGANTNGKGADAIYVGRSRLDGASLDRFAVMEFNYDIKIENSMVGENVFIADLGRMIRAIVKDKGISHIVSPRAMKYANIMYQADFKWDEILKMTFLKGLSRDDKNMIITELKSDKYKEQVTPKVMTGLNKLKKEL